MNNLEKMMDDSFPDLINQIQLISDRLNKLSADFFSKIFKEVFQKETKELKEHVKNQTEEVKGHVDERIKELYFFFNIQSTKHS